MESISPEDDKRGSSHKVAVLLTASFFSKTIQHRAAAGQQNQEAATQFNQEQAPPLSAAHRVVFPSEIDLRSTIHHRITVVVLIYGDHHLYSPSQFVQTHLYVHLHQASYDIHSTIITAFAPLLLLINFTLLPSSSTILRALGIQLQWPDLEGVALKTLAILTSTALLSHLSEAVVETRLASTVPLAMLPDHIRQSLSPLQPTHDNFRLESMCIHSPFPGAQLAEDQGRLFTKKLVS